MDTKRLKRKHQAKGVVRPKMANGDAEVFVLPPDLLHKLGINLGGIASVRECDMALDTQTGPVIGTEQPSSSQKMDVIKGDETILETASLMKKSVLLSPTFISTVSSIPGEVEISGIVDESNQLCDNEEPENSTNDTKVIQMPNESSIQDVHVGVKPSRDIHNYKDSVLTNDSQTVLEINNFHSNSDHATDFVKIFEHGNIGNNLGKTDINKSEFHKMLVEQEENVMNNKHVLDKVNELCPVIDHQNQPYSSEYTNGSLEPVNNLENAYNNSHCSLKIETVLNKINIISEEIIEPSKLKDVKILQSPNRMVLTPVTIKSIITRNKSDDFMESAIEDELHQKKNISMKTQSIKQSLNKSGQVSDIRNQEHIFYTNGMMTSVDMSRAKENYDLNQNSTRSCLISQTKPNKHGLKKNCSEELNIIVTEDQGSKYKNISNESILINERNIKNSSHIHYDISFDASCKNSVDQENKDETINKMKEMVAENIDMSVIPIQGCNDNAEIEEGVEKPGGNQERKKHKVIKTYQRHNRSSRHRVDTSVTVESKIEVTCKDLDVVQDNLNIVNMMDSCEMQKYCICGDFGRLDYYDCDSMYQHIHFWEQKLTGCNPEIIFSIYSDDNMDYYKDFENVAVQEYIDVINSDEISSINICWKCDNYNAINKIDVGTQELGMSQSSEIPSVTNYSSIVSYIDAHKKETNDKLIDIRNKEGKALDSKDNFKGETSCININNMGSINQYSAQLTSQKNKVDLEIYPATNVKETLLASEINKPDEIPMSRQPSPSVTKPYKHKRSKPSNDVEGFELKDVSVTNIDSGEINELISDKNTKNESTSKDTIKTVEVYIPGDLNGEPRDTTGNASRDATLLDIEEPDKDNSLHHVEKNNDKAVEVSANSTTPQNSQNFEISLVSIQTPTSLSSDLQTKTVYNGENQSEVVSKPALKETDINAILTCNDTMNLPKVDQNVTDDVSLNKSNVKGERASKSLTAKSNKEVRKSPKYKNKNIDLSSKFPSPSRDKSSRDSQSTSRNRDKSTDLNSTSISSESNIKHKNKKSDLTENSVSPSKNKKSAEILKSPPTDKIKQSSSKIKKAEDKNVNEKVVGESASQNKSTGINSSLVPKDINKDVDLAPEGEHKKVASKITPSKRNESLEAESKSTLKNKRKHTDTDLPQTPRKRNKTTDGVCLETLKVKTEATSKPHENYKNKRHTDVNPSLLSKTKKTYSSTRSKCRDVKDTDDVIPSTSKQTEVVVSVEKSVICGVCKEVSLTSEWISHISKEHNYLAWEDGSPALQFTQEEIQQHLYKISKENGGLICSKCGFRRKYVKSFLHHIKDCGIVLPINESVNNSLDGSISEANITVDSIKVESNELIKCGVCYNEIEAVNWINHIQKKHNYVAWVDGETPVDTDDAEQVQQHLLGICRKNGGLTCWKCGIVRKYVKLFLQHIKTCDEVPEDDLLNGKNSQLIKVEGVQCAVCSETMSPDKWKSHAMTKHYNIAWMVGRTPIDVRNTYAVEKCLKAYKEKGGKLTCKICKLSRVSFSGFYAHILTCGKTDEEVEMFKDLCEICNNKYLCIYKSPHMTAHKEQAIARERKLKLAEIRENSHETVNVEVTTGPRKAAEKAKSVIEKYKSNMNDGKYNCSKCGFSGDCKEELTNHECTAIYAGYSSDSDVSVKLENCSDNESVDSDVDSLVSEEEAAEKKRRHHKPVLTKVDRIPFSVKNTSSYLKESYDQFCKTHFTNETLFPQWRDPEYEPVPDAEVANYMPPLKHSCKVMFNSDSWTEYKRFEVQEISGQNIMFAGASVQCVSWAPLHPDDKTGAGLFLAVATHSGVDQPRVRWHETISHTGLLQIWDAGDFNKNLPKFVLGIAHDYGTVWAMDWCPSGARDLVPINQEDFDTDKRYRLGLLAVACSNGIVYIFSVPYPSTITEKDTLFYKLKPKVELRLFSNESREKSQATSMCWSTQKGHAIIIVGYSDGTSAFYDLQTQSPILKTIDNGVTVINPFHDERSQNSSVTGVSMYPSGAGSGARWCGAWCSASASGARLACGSSAARGAALHSYLASAGVGFTPLWPSALLAGADCVVNLNVNELEWFGGGRRLGVARALCAAGGGGRGRAGRGARGPRVLCCAPPLLRALRTHPLLGEIQKEVLGTIQMVPIAQKRKLKSTNDELAMKLEPLLYDDAVKQYGIELKLIAPKDNAAQQKALSLPTVHYPERYPLADVSSMSFCPSDVHDKKIALATHAGVIFLIDV